MSDGTEELLVRYVEQALARQVAGVAIELEELCREHPDLIAAVREAVELNASLPSPACPDPLLGRVLADRYRLEQVMGVGAMGVVYSAHDGTLGRDVAVKVLHPGVLISPERVERFRREARALATLSHANIVTVYDHGSSDGLAFLVMQRLAGISLASVINEAESMVRGAARLFPPAAELCDALDLPGNQDYVPMVVTWTADLAAALASSHDQGILHRDIKPSNVFITNAGQAKLLDFGIAVRLGEQPLTLGGTTLGTPWYMAPEQAGSQATVTPAVDIYGLCATLYHLVTFRPPYLGNYVDVLAQLHHADPPPPGKVRPGLPRDLGAILEKGMARRPAQRYRCMADLERDLRAMLAHEPLLARPLSRWTRTVRGIRHRPAPFVAGLIGLVVAVVAIGATLLWQAAEAAARTRYRELFQRSPSMFCFESLPEDRHRIAKAERAESIATLDEMIELRPDQPWLLVARAALCRDQGEIGRSNVDLARLAELDGSAYLSTLAAAYAGRSEAAAAGREVSATDLPEPTTALGWFVSGFNHYRDRQDYAAAHEHLQRASDYLPARDLRLETGLPVIDSVRNDRERRRQGFIELRVEARALQAEYGFATARTAHCIGVSLIATEDFVPAIESLRHSDRLRPNRYGSFINTAIAEMRLDRFAAAREKLRKARRLRPWLWQADYSLAQVHTELGEFDAAIRIANGLSTRAGSGDSWRRTYLLGQAFLSVAIASYGTDQKIVAEAARQSITAFREAVRQHQGLRNRAAGRITLARYLLGENPKDAQLEYMHALHADPTNPYLMALLADLLPDAGVSPESVVILREVLRSMAERLKQGRK